MSLNYSDERNAQIVVALLKAHGIRRIVASPGSSNMTILGSVQCDPWFKIWSAVDERHAAYMAVGLAAETGDPVVLTCTGATASRNYLPALTEAYYRKLPVLAITSAQEQINVGNLFAQSIDRSTPPRDCVRASFVCPPVENNRQAKACELTVNRAILELTRRGGGPVHINLETTYSLSFTTRELPSVCKIERYTIEDEMPSLPHDLKIAVYVANHKRFDEREARALDAFLNAHNAVAFCDATSHWSGEKSLSASLVCAQEIEANPKYAHLKPDLIIHIGEMSNDYSMMTYLHGIAPVWRVSVDGEVRDRFGRLEKVFEMPESFFFAQYTKGVGSGEYFQAWERADDTLRAKIPEFPFSNHWIAQQVMPKLRVGDVLHLGVSSTLQAWSAFYPTTKASVFANVGTCGIDGCVSTLIGASLAHPDKLYYGVVGDLTFFYDLNALGNRHIGKNIRLILVNNGCAGLFHTPNHIMSGFSDVLDDYMAARGHFGAKSKDLVRHFATDLGFCYLSASNKDDFAKALPEFLNVKSDKPLLFECFTEVENDSAAWGMRKSIDNYMPNEGLVHKVGRVVPKPLKDFARAIMG